MTDREEFEALKLSFGRNMVLATDGEYQSVETRKLLEVWQAARAQPAEQEPVAVVGPVYALDWVGTGPVAPLFKKHGIKVGDFLYTHPQPKREPLSVEAYTALAHRTASKYRHNGNPLHIEYTFLPHTLGDFVRAIEAAHGIEATKGGA